MKLNSSLKAPNGPYFVVLPACKMCLDNGCHIIVRGARQNAQAKQDKLDAQAIRDAARQAKVMANEGAAIVAEAPAEAPSKTFVAKAHSKSRKRVATRYTLILACIIVYIHAYCIAQHIAPLLTMMCGSWLCRMTDDTTGRTTRSKRGSKGGKRRFARQ